MKKFKLIKSIPKKDYEDAYLFLLNFLESKKNSYYFHYGYIRKINNRKFSIVFYKNICYNNRVDYEALNCLKILSTLPENSYYIFKIKSSNHTWLQKKIRRENGFNFSITIADQDFSKLAVLSEILRV